MEPNTTCNVSKLPMQTKTRHAVILKTTSKYMPNKYVKILIRNTIILAGNWHYQPLARLTDHEK